MQGAFGRIVVKPALRAAATVFATAAGKCIAIVSAIGAGPYVAPSDEECDLRYALRLRGRIKFLEESNCFKVTLVRTYDRHLIRRWSGSLVVRPPNDRFTTSSTCSPRVSQSAHGPCETTSVARLPVRRVRVSLLSGVGGRADRVRLLVCTGEGMQNRNVNVEPPSVLSDDDKIERREQVACHRLCSSESAEPNELRR